MRVKVTTNSVWLWLSPDDTMTWANRPGNFWPGSELSGHRVKCAFDSNGVHELMIDGNYADCNVTEFNAIVSDHLRKVLPRNHPLRHICVRDVPQPKK